MQEVIKAPTPLAMVKVKMEDNVISMHTTKHMEEWFLQFLTSSLDNR
jgi:hypothetical protein